MPRLAFLGVADDASTWATLGFTVEETSVRVGGTTIVCAGTSVGRGIVDWTLEGSEASIDGLAATARSVASKSNEPTDHVNGVVAIDHLVVSTPEVERTVAAFEQRGLECRRRREGAAYGQHRMRQAFFWLGDPDGPVADKVVLELVGPEVPDPARSADPATFFGLALTVQDLDATAAFYGDLMKPPVDAVQPGRRIATLSSRAGSSVAIAFMSTHV